MFLVCPRTKPRLQKEAGLDQPRHKPNDHDYHEPNDHAILVLAGAVVERESDLRDRTFSIEQSSHVQELPETRSRQKRQDCRPFHFDQRSQKPKYSAGSSSTLCQLAPLLPATAGTFKVDANFVKHEFGSVKCRE